MMTKRALLINPPTGLYIREDRCQAPLKGMAATMARPPLDLAYMAAGLEEAGVECRIRDYPVENGNWRDFDEDLARFAPEMLILSVTSFTLAQDLRSCSAAKSRLGRDVLTVVKGAEVSVRAAELLAQEPDLDVAVRGEYEVAVRELASGARSDWSEVAGITFRRGPGGPVVSTPDRPFLDNLDRLPFPARHLINNGLYRRPDTGAPQTTIQTSRGCPGRCIFCLAPGVYGSKIRTRSPGDVARELSDCVGRFGIRDFFFRADTFTWNKGWVVALCREIVERKLDIAWVCNSRVDTIDRERLEWMKKAGCHGIAFGIESGSQQSLDRMGKGISLEKSAEAVRMTRALGIKTLLYFVVGFPWETEEDIKKTADFAVKLRGDLVEFHSAIPFPGTQLEKLAGSEGLLDGISLDGRDYSAAPLRTKHVTAKRLRQLRRNAFIRVYADPRMMGRIALVLARDYRNPFQLLRALKFGFVKLAALLFPGDDAE